MDIFEFNWFIILVLASIYEGAMGIFELALRMHLLEVFVPMVKRAKLEAALEESTEALPVENSWHVYETAILIP